MIQPTFEGLEHFVSTAPETHLSDEAFAAIREAVDDFYVVNMLAVDYEPGDEGIFFEELFEIAVKQYEAETSTTIDSDTRERIKKSIQDDCRLLAEHGYDEPLFDEEPIKPSDSTEIGDTNE